jgi:hypothetical protein
LDRVVAGTSSCGGPYGVAVASLRVGHCVVELSVPDCVLPLDFASGAVVRQGRGRWGCAVIRKQAPEYVGRHGCVGTPALIGQLLTHTPQLVRLVLVDMVVDLAQGRHLCPALLVELELAALASVALKDNHLLAHPAVCEPLWNEPVRANMSKTGSHNVRRTNWCRIDLNSSIVSA